MDRATNIQTDRASHIGAKAPLKDEGGNRRNITARYELQRGDNRKFETCLAEEKKCFFFNACLLSEQSLCAWSLLSKPLKLKSIVWIVHASSSIQRLGALLKSAIRVYSPIAWEDRMYLQRAIHGTVIVKLKRNV